ncbi:MAG: hypothetical protein ACRDEA_01490, partial [Microcystaceae cyanobacterium]
PDTQTKLKTIASNNKKQPFLLLQGQNIAVFGHASATGGDWKLTNPLVTEEQLKYAAQQEKDRTNGATQYYQTLINYLFGSSQITSIFPNPPWDGSSPNPAIGSLDFDAGTSDPNWAVGQSLLYGYISQQNADIPAKGNWMSADASKCGIPNLISINGPGAQRLPVKVNQPCQIILKDTYDETMIFSLTPVSKQVTDNYTGAQVTVTSLPIGENRNSSPAIDNNLAASDLQNCQNNSPNQSIAGLCSNITLSAVWSTDQYSRDIVYMGLDPKDMPRVNVNLPAAPPNPVDPNVVHWPPNATMTFQSQSNGTVLVSWPAALGGANQSLQLQYLLYVWDGSNWTPQPCDQSTTSCSVKLGASARLYVIAINNAVSPPSQTPQLFGCYPAANPCPPVTKGKPTKTRLPKR